LAHLTKDVEDQPLPPANDMLAIEDGNALFYYLKELPDTFTIYRRATMVFRSHDLTRVFD